MTGPGGTSNPALACLAAGGVKRKEGEKTVEGGAARLGDGGDDDEVAGVELGEEVVEGGAGGGVGVDEGAEELLSVGEGGGGGKGGWRGGGAGG